MRVQADHVRAAIAAAHSAEVAAERGEVVAAGRALRACHDALVGVDGAGSGLEPLGMLREAARLAVRAPTEVAAAVDRALVQLAGVPHRIVHGDSHPGNVLWTRSGPLWGDWEDTHLAPLEWDLACLVAASRVRVAWLRPRHASRSARPGQ
jgi:aminoglycoside phosphotransferase (APT) family kinase protein